VGHTGLTATGDTGEDNQFVLGQCQIDVLEVMLTCSLDYQMSGG